MPTIDITRPELIWPGKYDENGNRVENRGTALPFQVIETIKEGRATREPGRMSDLFSFAARQDEGNWHNKLIWGDNLLVLASLMEEYAGKVDLIYIDPPFATGSDFSFTTQVGDGDLEITKQQSIIEEKAYRDTWGQGLDSYLLMIYQRLVLMKKLLSDRGSIYVHCDWRVNGLMRLLLDEIFGNDMFVNEIIWRRRTNTVKAISPKFSINTDSIFFYSKTANYHFENQYGEYGEDYLSRFKYEDEKGKYRWNVMATFSDERYEKLKSEGRLRHSDGAKYPEFKQYTWELKGRPIENIWDDINMINAMGNERLGYATQKPEALLERIVKASSPENGMVADFFCGSGTTAAAAEKLGRRWIACDLGRFAIHTTRKRMLDIPDCKPFEVLNLGKYERAYWQGVTFGEAPQEPNQAAIAAYIGFILELYKAQGLAGAHIHGKKGRALIHVGAVDAPVTINQVNEALAECAALGQKELHILGWEWEMGMNDPIIKHAQVEYGISLRLLNIPREVMEKRAVECGDIRFFDLAYLEAEVKPEGKGKRTIQVELKNFVIPDTDLIPDEVRDKIAKWSDYIDYWAVDWDFRHDTFMNQWQTYRTRTQRKLDLASDFHTYKEPGVYRILIKVVDIFGNDTNRLLEWEVK